MSETLRDLVVSLSLNSDQFTRNIASVRKQIKEAESSFDLAAAGVKGFETSAEGLSAKLGTLKQTLTLQKSVVTQYERALEQAKAKLQECTTQQETYTQKLTAAQTRQQQLKQEVANASTTYQRYKKTLGETNTATTEAKTKLDALEAEYKAQSGEVKNLQGQLKSLDKTTQNAANRFTDAQTKLNGARADVKRTESDIEDCNKDLQDMQSRWKQAGDAADTYAEKMKKSGDSAISIGRSMTMALTTPLTALGALAVKASISYESAFASVRKTVDMSEREYAELSQQIEQMSTEVAASADEIAEVVAVAGQLGIQNEHLMAFARTMIDLGNSTNLASTEAATMFAQFANIMGMDQSQFQNLGSALVDLGNNYATTESAIMEMAMRLAGAGNQVGLSESQILGFATALSSVGIEAEMGGSAFSKALIKMEVAAVTGGQALEDFGMVSGMTGDQFKALWESDPSAAFQAFIVGLSQMDDEGLSAIAVLDEIGFSEVRLRDTLLRATNATELFSSAQKTSANAWAQNSALSTEAGKRYATTESRLKNLKNSAVMLARQFGNDLNPTIRNLTEGASDLIERLMQMDEGQRMNILTTVAVIAAAGPLLLVLGKVKKGIGTVSESVAAFSQKVVTAGGGWKGFFSTVSKSPAVWMALAAAVGYGAAKIYDVASGAKQVREAIDGIKDTAEQWGNGAYGTFYAEEGLSFFGLTPDDFVRETESAQNWLERLTNAWQTGARKNMDTVNLWTDSWKAMTAGTREELSALKEMADAAGYTGLGDELASDIAELDDLDKKIANLLKSRRSRNLTAKELENLQNWINAREAIEVRYNLTAADETGFEGIRAGLEAEIARAKALAGDTAETVDAPVEAYEAAVVGAAEGMAAAMDAINKEYEEKYRLIQLMVAEDPGEDLTDEQLAARNAALEEQAAKLAELNEAYRAQRAEAAAAYAATLEMAVMPVWNQDDIQGAKNQLAELAGLINQYSLAVQNNDTLAKGTALEAINQLVAGMDEAAVTEYITLLTQLQSLMAYGYTEADIRTMFPEIDFQGGLSTLAGLQAFTKNYPTELGALNSILDESLGGNVLTITTNLDMQGATEDWTAWASDPGDISTGVTVTGYVNAPGVKTPVTMFGVIGQDYMNLKAAKDAGHTLGTPMRLSASGITEEVLRTLENAQFWQNGVTVTVTPDHQFTGDELIAYDENGTLHVMLTPVIEGTEESIKAAKEATEAAQGDFLRSDWLLPAGIAPIIQSMREYAQAFTNNKGTWQQLWGLTEGSQRAELDRAVNANLNGENLALLTQFLQEVGVALNNGTPISEDAAQMAIDAANLVKALQEADVGENVIATLTMGMQGVGFETSVDTLASDLIAALNSALGIEGGEESGGALYEAGKSATNSLAAGILSGQAAVESAMRRVARAAVIAAKDAARVSLPSGASLGGTGSAMARDMGETMAMNAAQQSALYSNAANHLPGASSTGGNGSGAANMQRTYNQQSTVTVTGNTFQIQDQQDISTLANEIAGLMKRQQRAMGARMV